MEENNTWIFADFKAELDELRPKIREKALKIAHKCMESGDFTQKEAIKKGITKAEEWFYDQEG